MVSYNTPMDVIEQLRSKIDSYITTNNRDWSGFALNIDKMEFQNALHLIVAIERELHSLIPRHRNQEHFQTDQTGKTGVADGLAERSSCDTLRRS